MAVKLIPGAEAFAGDTEEHLQSQAATLLGLGAYLRGHGPFKSPFWGSLIDRRKTIGSTTPIPAEEAAELKLPSLPPAYQRLSSPETRTRIKSRYGVAFQSAVLQEEDYGKSADVLPKAAEDFHKRPNHETAASLLAASLRHKHPLTRVAASSTYFQLTSEPRKTIEVLVDGAKQQEMLTRAVAAAALARISPDHPILIQLELNPPSQPAAAAGSGHTTIIVHGTWAKNGDWFLPGIPGNFNDYLTKNIAADMDQPFKWSGGWSDGARAQAAEDLRDWVVNNGHQGLNLFGHSHGGNVALLANQLGVTYGQIVLLSCPVHSDKYMPVFEPKQTSRRVVSIRVKMDLVILADGGGQRFKDSRIEENVLDIWFDHFATHDPKVWQKPNPDPKKCPPNMVDHTDAQGTVLP